MPRRHSLNLLPIIIGLCCLGLLADAFRPMPPVVAQAPTPAQRPASLDALCQQVLERAQTLTEQNCQATGRNQACYGYVNVARELRADAGEPPNRFAQSGDVLGLRYLTRIRTEPFNAEDSSWGMAILKMQANLPDTNPGQNVTFVLFGDTDLRPGLNHTNSVYLSTGLGKLTCKQLPTSGVIVRAPGKLKVAFTVNDVQISIASTILLRNDGAQMAVTNLEGAVEVSNQGVTQVLQPGQASDVPMNGTQASGVPSAPYTPPVDPALDSLVASAIRIDGDMAAFSGPITITGTIGGVDASVPAIAIGGYQVRVGGVSNWASFAVGDAVIVDGVFESYYVVAQRITRVNVVTGTPTATLTATVDASATPSVTPSATNTNDVTATSSATSTASATPTATVMPTETFTETPTTTLTATPEPTQTASETATLTSTDTATPPVVALPTRTPTNTETSLPPPTNTPQPPDPTAEPATLTPTSTETPTETATTSPTPTTTATAGGAIEITATLTPTATATSGSGGPSTIRLTALCSPNPDKVRRWQVWNPFPEAISVKWVIYGSTLTGELTVPPMSAVIFETETLSGDNTMQVFYLDKLVDVKASNPTACDATSAVIEASVTFTPTLEPSLTPGSTASAEATNAATPTIPTLEVSPTPTLTPAETLDITPTLPATDGTPTPNAETTSEATPTIPTLEVSPTPTPAATNSTPGATDDPLITPTLDAWGTAVPATPEATSDSDGMITATAQGTPALSSRVPPTPTNAAP